MLDDGMDTGGSSRKLPVRRSAQERAAIVAESYETGATVVGVARHHGLIPSQLSGWRSAARGRTAGDSERPFADISVAPDFLASTLVAHDGVEIMVGPVTIRLPKETAPKRIGEIAQRVARQA